MGARGRSGREEGTSEHHLDPTTGTVPRSGAGKGAADRASGRSFALHPYHGRVRTESPFAEALAEVSVSERDDVLAGSRTRSWQYGPPDASQTILAVHGYRGDHHGLEPVVAHLPEIRTIMPDLPGFGESTAFDPDADGAVDGGAHSVAAYARWLLALADRVRPASGQFTVLGHSFGSIVVAAALEAGLAVDRVVLINPIAAPALAGPKGILSRLTLAYYRVAAALPSRLAHPLLGSPAIVRIMSTAMAVTRDRDLRRWIHEEHARYFSAYASPRTVVEGFEASISDNVVAHADAFAMPTLLIGAERDQITARRDLVALADAIDGAELTVLDDVGHLIHYEKPAEAATRIREFLSGTAA